MTLLRWESNFSFFAVFYCVCLGLNLLLASPRSKPRDCKKGKFSSRRAKVNYNSVIRNLFFFKQGFKLNSSREVNYIGCILRKTYFFKVATRLTLG